MDTNDSLLLLARHGVKPTANRILVLKALDEARRPLSMTELEDEIETIDKSGIFRTLKAFVDAHLVHVIEDGGDSVRYELCHSHHDEVDDDQHAHFYCQSCHKTFCLDDTALPRPQVPRGFTATSVNYLIKGVCPDCAGHDASRRDS